MRLRVVICGAGIAGLTLAALLQRRAADVVVIEKAPTLRGGGYMIDFWGAGYDVAEAMGLLPAVAAIHQPLEYLRSVDGAGRPRFSMRYSSMRRVLGGRHFNFMRGDLERVLFEAMGSGVDVRFGTVVEAASQGPSEVEVTLAGPGGAQRLLRADLLVGADGIHSRLRPSVVGEGPGDCLRPMGYDTAAFTVKADAVGADVGSDFWMLCAPGRQVVVYPVRGGRVAAFLIHREVPGGPPATDARARLRDRYGDLGWVVPDLLAAAGSVDPVYYDVVAQVRAPKWASGRVCLLGDAAYCVSLVAGQGASVAMGGAWVLARALEGAGDDVPTALERFERTFRPEVERIQKAALPFARYFVPATRWETLVHDWSLRMLDWPGAWRLLRGQFAGARVDGTPGAASTRHPAAGRPGAG